MLCKFRNGELESTSKILTGINVKMQVHYITKKSALIKSHYTNLHL